MQAAAQKWVDSAISKTINVPPDYSYDDFVHLYKMGYGLGLKGCTTYRPNPNHKVGVLINKDDMENVRYRFKLEGGAEVESPANAMVSCDGELATAANLFHAVTTAGQFRVFINGGVRAKDDAEGVTHIAQPIISAELVEEKEPVATAVEKQVAPGSDFKRNRTLRSESHKIKRPTEGGNVYVTISMQDEGAGYRPVEMFINGYDATMEPWASAFALVVTGMMRAGVDISFMIEQIPQLVGYEPGWMGVSLFGKDDAKPVRIPSVVSEVVGAIKRTYDKLLEEQGYIPDPKGGGVQMMYADENTKPEPGAVMVATGPVCPSCRAPVEIIEGCKQCTSCGWSSCA